MQSLLLESAVFLRTPALTWAWKQQQQQQKNTHFIQKEDASTKLGWENMMWIHTSVVAVFQFILTE